jgi:hypothetical protein
MSWQSFTILNIFVGDDDVAIGRSFRCLERTAATPEM